ncbi:MAG: hypothetical protein WKF36_09670 [Candidatus Nitrosocosmicus sp.]
MSIDNLMVRILNFQKVTLYITSRYIFCVIFVMNNHGINFDISDEKKPHFGKSKDVKVTLV